MSKRADLESQSVVATSTRPAPLAGASASSRPGNSQAVGFLPNLCANAFARALLIYLCLNVALACFYAPAAKTVTAEFRQADLCDPVSAQLRKPWPWWLARGFITCTPPPDVVVFGSSQMGSAQATADAKFLSRWVDVVTHRKIEFLADQLKQRLHWSPTVLSLAVPGAVISDEYLMTRSLFTAASRPSLVVITVAPRDFIDDTLPSACATDQFKFFSKFVKLGELEQVAYGDLFARGDAKLKELPFRVMGTELERLLKPEVPADTPGARAVLHAIGAVATDPSPGQWVVPPVMPNVWSDNTVEYKHRFKGPNMDHYRVQMQFLATWLADLEKAGVKALVVGMPSLEMNRELLPSGFWQRFRGDLSEQCGAYHADWMDLSADSSFVKADFLDTVHLNDKGSTKLFPLIAARIQSAAHLQARTAPAVNRMLARQP